jgi:hypothetical protein
LRAYRSRQRGTGRQPDLPTARAEQP